jgi:lipopolysaccharide transport system permease protein
MKEDNWDRIITPRTGWLQFNLPELWQYRDLVAMLVRRDFVTFYKQTVLGPLWYIIQPLFTTVVFTIIFGKFAKISTDNIPPFLFYLSGTVAWGYFSNCLTQTSGTFISNANIFGKVYFPRLTVPLAVIITNMAQFLIQLAVFLGFFFYFMLSGAPLSPNGWIAATPLLLFQMALLGFGTGVLISSMTTKYRDLTFTMPFFIQLWMFATPIVYPLSQVPEQYRTLYALNPMVSVVECFRYAFLGISAVRAPQIVAGIVVTILLLFGGIFLFNRVEKTFMDTV